MHLLELADDFYLNLVDWSSQNVLSVGLGSCVYLWSACTSQVTRLCDLTPEADTVTSVAWAERVKYFRFIWQGLFVCKLLRKKDSNFQCTFIKFEEISFI